METNIYDVLDAQREHWHGRMVRDVNSIQKTADELLNYAKNPSLGGADRFPISHTGYCARIKREAR